ncbi:MAG: ribose 5-phosphate isomerase B [Clostridia bacterium]|nr:ribose 5-phosphate isomerase B [Clostridia bacterium]
MIAIGCDHGAFALKNAVKKYLEDRGLEVKDFGIYEEKRVDYPDIAEVVCKSIVSGECEKGILLCGTGIGISIAANKIKGIRAAVCNEVYCAKMAKCHNNANVITMGGRVVGEDVALEIVSAWLDSEFMGERHQQRIDKITNLEKGE